MEVISQARTASPKPLKGIGLVRLDTFIVGVQSGLPGPGYWPNAPCSEAEWRKAFAGAVVLHGDIAGPWEHDFVAPGRIVFVLSQRGWVAHGPVRATDRQAEHVANLLRKRIGWTGAVASRPPAVPNPLPAGLPTIELATTSPVWRDHGLAEKRYAHEKPRR